MSILALRDKTTDPTSGPIQEIGQYAAPRTVTRRHRALDVALTTLLACAVLAAFLALNRTFNGPMKTLSSDFMLYLGTAVSMTALFAILERIFPAGPQKSINGWYLNLRVLVLFSLGAQLAGVVSALLATTVRQHFGFGWIDLRFVAGRGTIALVVAFLLSIFVSDFFYYWTHRLQHKLKFLWQQHKLHHMDEEFNASTRGRVDWSEPLVGILTSSIPITVFFELDTAAAGAIGLVFGCVFEAWIVFYHSNIKLNMGWASVLFVGPQVHRIHHSRLPEHRDRNFAGNFPLWDVLFGTYYQPARDEFPPTGVKEEGEVKSFVEAVTLPYRGWWKMFCDSRTPLGPIDAHVQAGSRVD